MSDLSHDDRKLSEEEVAFIIRRASELQESEHFSQGEETSAGTLTLREVEQIARDADIDPRLVRRAAEDLAGRSRQELGGRSSKTFLTTVSGSASLLTIERVASGQVSTDVCADMVDEIRRTFDDRGVSSVSDQGFEWASTPAPGGGMSPLHRRIKARIHSREDVTTILVEEDLRSIIAPLFATLVLASGAGMMVLTTGVIGFPVVRSVAIGLSCVIAAAGAGYLLARTIFVRISSRRGRQLQDMARRLASRLGIYRT